MQGTPEALNNSADRNHIVFVTDRLPQAAEGGGELSFGDALEVVSGKWTAPNSNSQLTIVAFSPAIKEVQVLTGQNYRTILVPDFWACSATDQLRWARNKVTLVIDLGLAYLGKWLPRSRLAVHRALLPKVPNALLEKLSSEPEPTLVHGDNFRSVLLASQLANHFPNCKATGIVRDHRFWCALPSQPASIRGVPCRTPCKMECIPRRSGGGLGFVLRLWSKRTLRVRRQELQMLETIAVTSQFLKNKLVEAIPSHHSRIVVIGNRFPSSAQLGPNRALTDALNGHRAVVPKRVAVIGMLNENKGQLQLVRAMADSSADSLRNSPELGVTMFHFFGRGERVEAIIGDAIEEHGLLDNVTFDGYVENHELRTRLLGFDAVALPTIWPEPFGRVPLEAAAAGVPVVAFDVGALSEHIIEGVTGRLVAAGDYQRFFEAIREILRDPDKAKELVVNAQKYLSVKYSASRMNAGYDRLWR